MKNLQNPLFKAGDLVYYPRASSRVLRLKETIKSNQDRPLRIEMDDFTFPRTFYDNGLHNQNCNAQEIFHATQQNYELLSKLYPNVEFEPPPKRKEPKEIIQAMLDSGWEYVPLVTPIISDETSEVTSLFPLMVTKSMWENPKQTPEVHALIFKNGVPIDPKTGKTIIDFVDGEVVLESEND